MKKPCLVRGFFVRLSRIWNSGIIATVFNLWYLAMVMRPAVRNRSIMLIVFSVVQWLFMRYILANNLFNLDTNDRIVYFCLSSILGALLIFVGLIYMVLKGNPDKDL